MGDTVVLRLGGRPFEIGPLTFRQLRDIEAALKAGSPARLDFDAAIDIIVAALSRNGKAMDRDAILDLEGTKAEFVAATRTVLRWGGYIESGESNPGEERAGN